MHSNLVSFLESLAQSERPTLDALSARLQCRFNVTSETPLMVEYGAALAPPFRTAAVRTNIQVESSPLLTLVLADVIKRGDLDLSRFGEAEWEIIPEMQPEGMIYESYSIESARISFGFRGTSQILDRVTLVWR